MSDSARPPRQSPESHSELASPSYPAPPTVRSDSRQTAATAAAPANPTSESRWGVHRPSGPVLHNPAQNPHAQPRAKSSRPGFAPNCRMQGRTQRHPSAGMVLHLRKFQFRIPTGFRPPAQGCEERATLGIPSPNPQPQRGCGPAVSKPSHPHIARYRRRPRLRVRRRLAARTSAPSAPAPSLAAEDGSCATGQRPVATARSLCFPAIRTEPTLPR